MGAWDDHDSPYDTWVPGGDTGCLNYFRGGSAGAHKREWKTIRCQCEEIELENEQDGRFVPGVRVTCPECGESTESYGTGEASIKRCCVLLREGCTQHDPDEKRWYEVDEGAAVPADSFRAICGDFVRLFDAAVASGAAPGEKSSALAARARKLLKQGKSQ